MICYARNSPSQIRNYITQVTVTVPDWRTRPYLRGTFASMNSKIKTFKIPPGVYRDMLERLNEDGVEVSRVGVREFRQHMLKYIDADVPLIMFRHSDIVGVYVPMRVKNQRTLEQLRAVVGLLPRERHAASESRHL